MENSIPTTTLASNMPPYHQILKRTGIVLVSIGILDILWMVYCLLQKIPYSSSFNLFAVIGGVLLLRGNLRSAIRVRWFSTFACSAFMSILTVSLLMRPIDLTLTQMRLYPGITGKAVLILSLIFALLVWVSRELGCAPVRSAVNAAGYQIPGIKAPIGWGIIPGLLFGLFSILLLRGDNAVQAKAMAEQQLGPGYSYFVSSLNVTHNSQGKTVSGRVTAWNHQEIRYIPITWEEP